MRILALQHVAFENVGMIGEWAVARGHTLTTLRIDEWDLTQKVPTDFDMLVLMGGPMSVNDETKLPWLIPEKTFIREAIAQNKHILGICLGAQLIASSLGAKIYPNPVKEIGWFPIAIPDSAITHPLLSNQNPAMTVFHWHGETFDLPEGAQLLMSSKHCQNQAFLYHDKVLGLQFHLEMGEQNIAEILQHCADELIDAPTIQSATEIQNKAHNIAICERALYRLLDQLTRA